MGNSKSKKSKSSSDLKSSKEVEPQGPSNPPPQHGQHQEDEEEDVHESWNDPMLFSRTESPKVLTKDDFEIVMHIGDGSFGKVNRTTICKLTLLQVEQVRKKDDGKIYAMKILRKEAVIARKQVAHTKAEKSILSKIQHPFIIRLHYAFQTKDKLYMVMDFVNGGELFTHLKNSGRFSENRVKFYSAEIVSAISHLHSLGIVYRDLKPENILLDSEGHICITDFGLSKEITPEEGTQTFCGTPEYLGIFFESSSHCSS
jgi:serine/threonine protein kinase